MLFHILKCIYSHLYANTYNKVAYPNNYEATDMPQLLVH